MGYLRKLRSTTFGVPCVFAVGLMTILLGMTSFYTMNQVSEEPGYLNARQHAIQHYEDSGDYAAALDIARTCYEESLNKGLSEEARKFSQIVNLLEKELLALGYSRLLFDENYQPRVKLLQILEFLGMEHLNKGEKAVVQISNWAQKNLLRQGERWDDQTSRFEELKPKIKPLLDELGFVKATFPHFKEYQGALVHGALLPRLRLRLQYLVEQWKQGVRFSHIYFLSGERPLNPQYENESTLAEERGSLLKIRKDWLPPLEFPKTESEMTQLLWQQSDIPEDMRKQTEVHFINAPMKKDLKSGKLIRPTTDDTVKAWLKAMPSYGRYLAISNAPYTNRLDLVVRAIAPCKYGLETIGPKSGEEEKMAIFLDELARLIFETKQISERLK